jgi:pimeloyl-ACP methyl ester carboxylesterase
VAERLAAVGRDVVAPDQRGYSPGARPAEVAGYALPHLVADVVAMIELLGSSVHLVGHDWGGVVGWQVASRRPDLVRSWTAVSTAHPLALAEVMARDPAERERFGYIRTFRETGRAETMLLAHDAARLRRMYGAAVAPERVAADVAFFAQPGVLSAALSWYRAMSRDDAADLPRTGVPTAYVWGSADPAFGPAAAAATGSFVDGRYRFVPLDGAGHWLPDEAPDTLAEVIADLTADGTDG